MNKVKKIFIGVVVLMVLFGGVVVYGAFYLLDYALCPEMINRDMAEKKIREAYPQINLWLDSLQQVGALKDTCIMASDGATLHGIYAHAKLPDHRTAVIVHGYTDQAVEMLHLGYMYHHDLGFNILLPDLRYAGETAGEAIQMGWKDREDLKEWLEFVPHLFGDSVQLVVHGISMGAATVMMTAGEDLPATVKCFVEDCGYVDVWQQFKKELDEQFGLPAFPLLHVASLLCSWKYGWDFNEASALEQVKKCRLPMLFIHGDQDGYVPTWMVYELYAAKSNPKRLWVTEGVDHAHSYKMYPKEYTDMVIDFTGECFR